MSKARAEDIAIPATLHHRPVPATYREGAVAIAVPKNPSTPVPRARPVPFVRLYTGPPVDLSSDDDLPPPSSAKRSRRTPSSTSKPPTVDSTPQTKPKTPTSTSTTKLPPTSTPTPSPFPISSPLPPATQPNSSHSHPHDSAEAFSASRLESLIPLPFIASASDSRRNAILPPLAPKPTPTRYTILFDAAHKLIMHQSVLKGATAAIRSPSTSPNPGSSLPNNDQTQLLHELTNISHRQAKYILELESQNAMLRKVAADAAPKVTIKRKRRRKHDEKQPIPPPDASMDPNPDPQLNTPEQHDPAPTPTPQPQPHPDSHSLETSSSALTEEQQREQRAQKLARVQRQQARVLLESEDDEEEYDVDDV